MIIIQEYSSSELLEPAKALEQAGRKPVRTGS